MAFVFFIYCLLLLCRLNNAQDVTEDDDEHSSSKEYGVDWVLFPDDLGNLHFANITTSLFGNYSLEEYEPKIHFKLYTRKNPEQHEELFIDENEECNENRTENLSNYNPEKKLQVLIHGWRSSAQSSSISDLKDAYLDSDDVNVLAVDWSKVAREITYIIAAEMTQYVGEQTGKMVLTLMRRYCSDGRGVHLVGHSLGAHVSGYAGRYLRRHNLSLHRITGLDPARPLFEIPFTRGLNISDAMFVDIIHTNGGVLGIRKPRGHADFFPNGGGPSQPGCHESGTLPDACAHSRSHQFFAESIIHGGFGAVPCEDWSEYKGGSCKNETRVSMGQTCPHEASGLFYLRTNAASRYSQDEDERNKRRSKLVI